LKNGITRYQVPLPNAATTWCFRYLIRNSFKHQLSHLRACCRANRLQVRCNRFALFPVHEVQAGPDQMDDAGLHQRARKNGLRLHPGILFSPSVQMINASFIPDSQIHQHRHPELLAFLLMPITVKHCPVVLAILPHLHYQCIQVNNWIQRFKRSILPRLL